MTLPQHIWLLDRRCGARAETLHPSIVFHHLNVAARIIFICCERVPRGYAQLLTVEERKIWLQGSSEHWLLGSGRELDLRTYADKVCRLD